MTDSIDRAARVTVVYYSATGHVHALATAVAQGAEDAGAIVRLRHVEELAPEMLISQNQAWGRHRSAVSDEPTATLDDLDWADGIAFGTPTRFGNVAAQLKLFLDQAGQLWEDGKLLNKVVTSFTSSQTEHGGQESTILALNNTFYHWGAVVLPLGYTVKGAFNGGGNPYGASYTSGTRVGQLDPHTVASALAQGGRLARVARVIGSAQEQGLLDVRRRVVAGSEMRTPGPLDGSESDRRLDAVGSAPQFPTAPVAKRRDQASATRRHVGDPPGDPLSLNPYSPIGQRQVPGGTGTAPSRGEPELRQDHAD